MELSARALRCAGFPLLVLGLIAATAVDADGDVATTNLPSIVFVSTRGVQAVDHAEIETPDSRRSDERNEIRCAGPQNPQAR